MGQTVLTYLRLVRYKFDLSKWRVISEERVRRSVCHLPTLTCVVAPFYLPGMQAAPQGCRQTRGQADASLDQAARAQRVHTVRLRCGGRVTEHELNWDAW